MTNSNATWMKQIARNLTDCEDGFLNGTYYLLMDRDGKFSPAFREIVKNEGVKPVRYDTTRRLYRSRRVSATSATVDALRVCSIPLSPHF